MHDSNCKAQPESPSSNELAIEKYRDYLLLVARSLLEPRIKVKFDASDLVQQTMLDAHRNLHQFEGKLENELGAWMQQILRNNFLNAVRDLQRDKRDIRREKSVDWERAVFDSFSRVDHWLVSTEPSPSQQVSTHEQMLRLPRALNQLPETQREAIVSYHIQGLMLAEVADRMKRTESSIAGLLYRGLQNLRSILKQKS